MASLGMSVFAKQGLQSHVLRRWRMYGVNPLKIRRKNNYIHRKIHMSSTKKYNMSTMHNTKYAHSYQSWFGFGVGIAALVVGYGVYESDNSGYCSGNSSSKRRQNWKDKYGGQAVCLEIEMEGTSFASFNLHVTKLRDKTVGRKDFVMHVERLMGQLAEIALSRLPIEEAIVTSPTGRNYTGVQLIGCPVAAVSILRSGDAMLPAFIKADPNIDTGKLLITRLQSKTPELLYSKLPVNLGKEEHQIMLLDPMLASGTTMLIALEELIKENNVKPENIQVVSIFGCEEAVQKLLNRFPGIRILFVSCDERDPDTGLLVPGVGSFGDRYFGSAP